jgi:hypothetical protein
MPVGTSRGRPKEKKLARGDAEDAEKGKVPSYS